MEAKKTPAPSEPTARSSKSALLEAAQGAIADQKLRAETGAKTGPRARTGLRVFLAAIMVASAAVLVAQPAWLVGPKPPGETPAIQAATATMALVEVVSQLQAFQTTNGHLPATLEAVGVTDPAIRYQPGTGGHFEVSMAAGDSVVSIQATDSLKTRVVDAIRVLQGRTLR